MRKIRAFLELPSLPWVLLAVAILLTLPSLWIGWAMDDHVLRYAAAGGEGLSAELYKPTGLFGFLGDPEVVERLKERGSLPWWTAEGFRLAFWRPLSSLTHWLDFRLWPENAFLMHLQSVLLYGLLVLVVTRLYRQTMAPAWVAGLAALAFTVDDAHAQAVAWISARNSLLGTLFGCLALIAHDRWRRQGWRVGAFLGPFAFLLSLLSKEMGVAIGGYVAAHAAFVDRGPWQRRLLVLVPYGIVLLAWRILYGALGYGVFGSGMYVDPLAAPLQFLAALGERAPALILGLWGQPPADFATVGPEPMPTVMWFLGTTVLALLVVLLKPLLQEDRIARFWAAGMIGSIVLASTSLPANRYLLTPSLGAMGLLALFLRGWVDGWPGASPTRAWAFLARTSAVILVGTHLVLAPLLLAYGTWALAGPAGVAEGVAYDIPNDPALSNQDLVIVNAPDFLIFTGYLYPIRSLRGLPVAKRHSVLATGSVALELLRVDERTLSVRSDKGFPSGVIDSVYRSNDQPFAPGERIHLPAMTVEIREVSPKNLVTEALFRFGVPLEDPSLRWVRWDDGGFVPFEPPQLGETSQLEAAVFYFAEAKLEEEPREESSLVNAARMFRDHVASGRFDQARAMMADRPRRWFDERRGDGQPWSIGPRSKGPWDAWDEHFRGQTETVRWIEGDGSATVVIRETNDYFRLLKRGWVTNEIIYFFDDSGSIEGLLIRATGERPSGRTDDFLEWARENDPQELEYLMPGGDIDPSGDRPERFRALLNRWRSSAELPVIQ
jgi:hypothetical protein